MVVTIHGKFTIGCCRKNKTITSSSFCSPKQTLFGNVAKLVKNDSLPIFSIDRLKPSTDNDSFFFGFSSFLLYISPIFLSYHVRQLFFLNIKQSGLQRNPGGSSQIKGLIKLVTINRLGPFISLKCHVRRRSALAILHAYSRN